MTRLVPRIPRRRRGVPDEPATGSPPEPGATGTGGAEALGRPEPTTVLPAGASATAPPAEPAAATDPDAAERPSFKDRGRARRRLRYLRRVRELGFRDLGGLVFDQHRFGRRDEALVDAKVTALGHVDSELRALERAL